MKEQIKNPYVTSFSKVTKSWTVIYRYTIAGKINFKYVCSTPDLDNAKQIARLLNKEISRE